MAIDLRKLKELDERDCYYNNRHRGITEVILIFLKDNLTKAYTTKEITSHINTIKDYSNIKSSLTSNILQKLKTRKGAVIHKKGSYYWYEEIKQ